MRKLGSEISKMAGILCIMAIYPGCEFRTNDSVRNAETVRSEILHMFDSYHGDIAEEGLTGEFKYLDSSSDFFWVPPGYSSALSYDSVHAILERNAPAFKQIQFHWDTLTIIPLSHDIATYHGTVGGSMTDMAGRTSPVLILESGTVIKRQDGWKLLCGQSRSLVTEGPVSGE